MFVTVRRTLALLLTLTMLAVAAPAAGAATALPFALEAPAHVTLFKLQGDSPTSLCVTYDKNNEMAAFLRGRETAEDPGVYVNQYGYSDLWINAQIDWAIDDAENGWHATRYWDGADGEIGYSADGEWMLGPWDVTEGECTSETTNDCWILRGLGDADAYAAETGSWEWNGEGNGPGLKDQLDPAVYTIEEDGLHIDYAAHTAYVRVRYCVSYVMANDSEGQVRYAFSDWSAPAAYNAADDSWVPLTAADLPAPDITDLFMTDELIYGQPVVGLTLAVPDEVARIGTQLAAPGGTLRIVAEARVKGTQEWRELQGDTEVTPGEMHFSLHALAEEGEILTRDINVEIRCRYCASQYSPLNGEWVSDFDSEYSRVLSFGTGSRFRYGDINVDGAVNAADALQALQHSVKLLNLVGDSFDAADVDGNLTVNASDALLILQHSVKLISVFPVETL